MISVILPVRDGQPWLEAQLQALVGQQGVDDWELIVADNGSRDGSPAVAKWWADRHEHVRWFDANTSPGASGTRNAAAKAARGDRLAFCDADDLVQPDWLAALAQALGDAEVAAGIFDFWSLNGRRNLPPVAAAMQQFGFLPAGLSANLAVRRDAFEEVGGFDEGLAVGEDIDLCWRLQLAGFRFVVEPGAVVFKREPLAFREIFRQAFAYGRCGPVLYRRYRRSGARRDLAGAAKSWLWLLLHSPRLVKSGPERGEWARAAGMRIGRLAGSIGQGAFFP
jgi:GT2 family glycosyltransferase